MGDTTATSYSTFNIQDSSKTDFSNSSWVEYLKSNKMMVFWIIVVVVLLLVLIIVVIVAIVSYDKGKKNKNKGTNKPIPNAARRRGAQNKPQPAATGTARNKLMHPPARYMDDDSRRKRDEYMLRTTMMKPVPGTGAGKGKLPTRHSTHSGQEPQMFGMDISESELKEVLQPGKPLSCLMFYSPSCPPCHKVMPNFQKAASMRPNLAFYLVNIKEISPEFMRAFGVDHTPKIVRCHPEKGSFVEYHGDRSSDDILKFAMQSRGVGEMKRYL